MRSSRAHGAILARRSRRRRESRAWDGEKVTDAATMATRAALVGARVRALGRSAWLAEIAAAVGWRDRVAWRDAVAVWVGQHIALLALTICTIATIGTVPSPPGQLGIPSPKVFLHE